MRTLIYILLFGLALEASAQDMHPYIKNFKARSINGKLLVTWTTKPGFSCTDIAVQISKDSSTYKTGAIYFGICGDFDEKDYSLTVDSPFLNTKNYLRLDLGNFGYSYVISQTVILVNEAKVIPHPLQNESTLYFKNNLREKAEIRIYSTDGQLLSETLTESNQIPIRNNTNQSLLIYTISFQGVIRYRGKIVVQD
ncbi:hypothetical protein GYB22_01850 [bacterium]|nr:hypothetical protein [bacterium]